MIDHVRADPPDRKYKAHFEPLDFARCDVQTCPLKTHCLRYTAVPYPDDRQHYIRPYETGLSCYTYVPDMQVLKLEKRQEPERSAEEVISSLEAF